MKHPIRYRGVTIEDIPGVPWTVAYGRRDDGVVHITSMQACPDYASDELRLAAWDYLVADVLGGCDLCGVVAAIPPEMKVAPPGRHVFVGDIPLQHRDECPCARLKELDCRDSPDGLGTDADESDESRSALIEYLSAAVEVLR